MKSKHIIISGLLASLLLIFLCIFMNAERYYNELQLEKQNPQEINFISDNKDVSKNKVILENTAISKNKEASRDKVSSEVVSSSDFSSDRFQNIETDENSVVLKSKTKVETSTFIYTRTQENESISGILPLLENDDELKSFISHCAKDDSCKDSVTFIDNEETLSWKNLIVSMLKFIYQEKIRDTQITLKNHEILIEGEFQNTELKERFLSLMSDYDTSYEVIDKSTVYIEKEEEHLIVKTPEKELLKETVKEVNQSLIVEEKIAKLLHKRPITFQKNKGAIRLSGRKTLDEIAPLLKEMKHFSIIVEGHTDAGGKARINMRISQARAVSVKRYLIKKGLHAKQIVAKGYGETKLLSSISPNSKLNRRVEIHLKELR